MILKIRQFENMGALPAPEHVVECDRYTKLKYDKEIDGGEDARYFWHGGSPDKEIKLELIVFSEGQAPQQIFLLNAVVYVMNNEGKTIDTIYAV